MYSWCMTKQLTIICSSLYHLVTKGGLIYANPSFNRCLQILLKDFHFLSEVMQGEQGKEK